MERAEEYPPHADLSGDAGHIGPLLLTCSVDCQHTYLQYEIVGWGRAGESWGIKAVTYWLYVLGVNAGKAAIMQSVAVGSPGASFMHLPQGEERGYDIRWYSGLLSETPAARGASIVWEKIPRHERNEALDCRNYARAAMKVINPDFDALARALTTKPKDAKRAAQPAPRQRPKSRLSDML